MKNNRFRVWPWLAGASLCGAIPARAQEAPTRPANVLNTLVAPLDAATPTETLLKLAQAADINLLADVDDAEATALPREPSDKPRTLFSLLKELGATRDWSWQRASDRTFLAWKQPDVVALARQIMANEAAPNGATAPVAPAVADATAEPVNVALTRYFATPAAHNDPKKPADWREVPLLELPPELRERIIESVRGQQRGGLQFAASGAVLGAEFWKTAVLKLSEINAPAPLAPGALQNMTPQQRIELAKAPGTPQKYLFVVGQFERDGQPATTMLSLGRWKTD